MVFTSTWALDAGAHWNKVANTTVYWPQGILDEKDLAIATRLYVPKYII